MHCVRAHLVRCMCVYGMLRVRAHLVRCLCMCVFVCVCVCDALAMPLSTAPCKLLLAEKLHRAQPCVHPTHVWPADSYVVAYVNLNDPDPQLVFALTCSFCSHLSLVPYRGRSDAEPNPAHRVHALAVEMLRAARSTPMPTTGGPVELRIGMHTVSVCVCMCVCACVRAHGRVAEIRTEYLLSPQSF